MTRADEIEWPAVYVDPETGEEHAWDDEVPADEFDEADPEQPYTYREMAFDVATARGMDIDEYLNSLAYQRNDYCDDGDVPEWADEDYY